MTTPHLGLVDPAGPAADPIAALHTALVADLAATLDLRAGAADATQPRHLTDLAKGLRNTLDLAAGVAAVVGAPADRPKIVVAGIATGGTPSESSWTIRLADRLTRLHPAERLDLRDDVMSARLIQTLDLAAVITHAHSLARALARVRGLTRARKVASDLEDALDQARVLARDLGPPDLTYVFDDMHSRTHDVDFHLRKHDIANSAGTGALAKARATARVVTHHLTGAHERCRVRVHEAAADLARNPLMINLDVRDSTQCHAVDDADLRHLRRVLDRVANDFTGVDLRAVTLDVMSLDRLRWSAATRWPSAGLADRVRAFSVEIAPGVFEVTGHGRRGAFDVVPT